MRLDLNKWISLLYILFITLLPLNPLHSLLLIPIVVLIIKMKIMRPLKYVIVLGLILLSLSIIILKSSYIYYATITYCTLLFMLNLVFNVKKGRLDLILTYIIVTVFSSMLVIHGSLTFNQFITSVLSWIKGIKDVSSLHPLYLTLLINLVLITLVKLYGELSSVRLGSEGIIPILLFMFLLISSAILLALGNEARANKLAELAYYNLVIGVVIEIYKVARGHE